MRTAPPIVLSEDERAQLTKWSHGRSTSQRLVLRSRIVLRAADGLQSKEIAVEFTTADARVKLRRLYPEVRT